ncbi:hypothetical protein [Streptomyces radicis]|uniref:DUF2157 domain-containing protein n=1 Tax=Streptomyces radicis TaxID=1750517 RepID=A0A3A9WK31_9ACTN|nr:hypothetical protein [Streptomyces radicis]RKN09824.1 hypothetical protein D7319_11520 [Streptomyces radicis]RKN23460.1 hypothetical protein D7318_12475 [Streptomyces radicis]
MGIESEQLVYDYLSRVGDLAHGTSMSAAQRASLVNRVRDEIGRERAAAGGAESRSAVKRILGRMGPPEDIVAAAAHAAPAPAPSPPATPPSAPSAPARAPEDAPVPPPREAEGPVRLDKRPGHWPDGQIGRFFGGIEIPELLRPPLDGDPEEADERADEDPEAAPDTAAPQEQPEAPPAAQRPSRRRRLAHSALAGKRVGGPVELLGVAVLVAGTAIGSVVALGAGWLIAYWSPRLSRREAQWATFGMPALVAGGYATWLLGRAGGYWGAALAEGDAEAAFADHWPLLLRGAALATAAFLLYRARRRVPAGG